MIARAILACVCLTLAGCSQPASPAATTGRTAAPADSAKVSLVSGTGPRNAVVSLQPASGEIPLPEGPAVMDQYAKQFVPNTLFVRVGQPVEFRNSEDMPHNVMVVRRGPGTLIFNVGTEPREKHVHTFDRVGAYDVSCDIHPGMQATLVAASSPIATVADDAGKFTFQDVAVGSYKLSLTFEGRTVEQTLDVNGPRTDVRIAQ